MTDSEKYNELFRKMMYNISGHSLLVKKNNANKHIAILCDEVQKERVELGFAETNYWRNIKELATTKSKKS